MPVTKPQLVWTINRPHCEQFSLEPFSTEELVLINGVVRLSGYSPDCVQHDMQLLITDQKKRLFSL